MQVSATHGKPGRERCLEIYVAQQASRVAVNSRCSERRAAELEARRRICGERSSDSRFLTTWWSARQSREGDVRSRSYASRRRWGQLARAGRGASFNNFGAIRINLLLRNRSRPTFLQREETREARSRAR